MRSRKGERKYNNDAIVFQLKTKKEIINLDGNTKITHIWERRGVYE